MSTEEKEEKKLEEKVKELTKAVEALIELEKARAKLETTKLQNQIKTEDTSAKEQEAIDKEVLKAELKEHHLGELVAFAIKKNLIKTGPLESED